MTGTAVLLAVLVAVLVAVLASPVLRRGRHCAVLERALADPDPDVRRAAVLVVAADGSRPCVRTGRRHRGEEPADRALRAAAEVLRDLSPARDRDRRDPVLPGAGAYAAARRPPAGAAGRPLASPLIDPLDAIDRTVSDRDADGGTGGAGPPPGGTRPWRAGHDQLDALDVMALLPGPAPHPPREPAPPSASAVGEGGHRATTDVDALLDDVAGVGADARRRRAPAGTHGPPGRDGSLRSALRPGRAAVADRPGQGGRRTVPPLARTAADPVSARPPDLPEQRAG